MIKRPLALAKDGWPVGNIHARGRHPDIRKQLTSRQLRLIGLVAMEWNECEVRVDAALSRGMRLRPRLVDPLIILIPGWIKSTFLLRAAQDWNLSKDDCETLQKTFRFIGELKSYRDAVVHCTVFDTPSAIGTIVKKPGIRHEVFLSSPALDGVYRRLTWLRRELEMVGIMFHDLVSNTAPRVPETQRWLKELQKLQKRRESLAPLPPFPKLLPSPIAMGVDIYQSTRRK